MDPMFSHGDIALLIAFLWVLLAGGTLTITYLIKSYSRASATTRRLFNLSWLMLIPGASILIVLAYIVSQIKKESDGAEQNFYEASEKYNPILAFFDQLTLPTLILTTILALLIVMRRK